MKLVTILSLIAFACAIPIDDKNIPSAQKSVTHINNNQNTPDKPISEQATASSPSKCKRDTLLLQSNNLRKPRKLYKTGNVNTSNQSQPYPNPGKNWKHSVSKRDTSQLTNQPKNVPIATGLKTESVTVVKAGKNPVVVMTVVKPQT
ncbi:hypothetical protein PVAND_007710 [Polypedilum vanderplanki]|uniref:Uncharacterized protein n=1 Tax=Polypedilum vanderplanki TaxID=319348 RepID=A0A9J6C7S9_POLVA|nr:hypothetical protein PVAND_007710 [Polypedilum vanderplanki]